MKVEAISSIVDKLTDGEVKSYATFFTFEGGEGSGKSTVLARVSQMLAADGIKTLATREPGGRGSQKAEAIRSLMYEDYMSDMDDLTAAFLYAASRTQHVQEIILPHLQAGYVVLCDRYVDSSLVYQGLEPDKLASVTTINKLAIQHTMPATTLFFDVPPEVGLARIFAASEIETNYIDHKDMSFHETIYDGYKVLAQIFTDRYVTIDATKAVDDVARDVYTTIKARLAEADGN
jgi:dTMP kinase